MENKLVIECKRCKTRFEIWLSERAVEENVSEEAIRQHFLNFCPVCKELEKQRK